MTAVPTPDSGVCHHPILILLEATRSRLHLDIVDTWHYLPFLRRRGGIPSLHCHPQLNVHACCSRLTCTSSPLLFITSLPVHRLLGRQSDKRLSSLVSEALSMLFCLLWLPASQLLHM